MKNDMIETFLNKRLLTSPRTRKNYRVSIQNYFKLLEENMETYFNKGIQLEKYEDDLQRVYMIHEENEKPLVSRRALFSAVKQFMIYNDKRLKDLDFWDTLKMRMKGAESATQNLILNPSDVKEILSHGNTCTRALFIILVSSGRRIGEILALTPKDIDATKTPATVRITKGLVGKEIRSTKTKATTICFISNEARDAYLAWMKERDTYLQQAVQKSHLHKKNPNDSRVFPMSYDNALFIFRKMIEKGGPMNKFIGEDEKTKRGICHPHILRRVFRSYLGDSDFAEFLMGHGTPLTKAYRQMKQEDMAEKYLKLMPNISIFEVFPDFSSINESLKEKDEEIAKLNQRLDTMRVADLESEVRDLYKLVKGLESIIYDDLNKQEALKELQQREYEWQQKMLKENPPAPRTKK
jgi:integrase